MFEAAFSAISRIIQVVLGIGFVIFVHELGHFLVAKWVGVRVEVFSLGFGPRLFGFLRGDTDYRVSAVPLGGYVKMAGENPDEPSSGAGDEFTSKPVGARAAVIVAGVCMNAIFAMIMFLLAFKLGVRMQEPAVGRVVPGSAAADAGLRYGDRVLEINGAPPLEFMDLSLSAAFAPGEMRLVVERRGERVTVTCTPRKSADSPIQQLGFGAMSAVHGVREGSAAAAAGLRDGDWIVGIDGKAVSTDYDIIETIARSPERPIPLDVRRAGGGIESVTLTPQKRPARALGLMLAPYPLVGSVSPGSAAEEAGIKPGDLIVEAFGAPADLNTFSTLVTSTPAGEKVKLAVLRGPSDERVELALAPRADPAVPGSPPRLGIGIGWAIVGDVAPGSPAAAAGILPGDRILKADGKAASSGFGGREYFEQLANEPENAEKVVTLELRRKGAVAPVQVTLKPAVMPDRFNGDAGFDLATATFVKSVPGVIEPIRLGFDRTITFTEQVFLTLQGMLRRRIDPSTLGGPIGIASVAYQVADQGFAKLLYFLAIISVNLAVLNILPIPILDGGHLVFLGVEKLKGSPVSPSVLNAAQWVGLVMLLALMVYVTKNDIVRWIGG